MCHVIAAFLNFIIFEFINSEIRFNLVRKINVSCCPLHFESSRDGLACVQTVLSACRLGWSMVACFITNLKVYGWSFYPVQSATRVTNSL